MMKKLINEVIDLKNSVGESSSSNRYFELFFKCKNNPLAKSTQNSSGNMNVEELGLDDFYLDHQASRLDKTCVQWINSMPLVINKLLDDKSIKDQSEQQVEEESNPANDNSNVGSTMLLWDVVDKE